MHYVSFELFESESEESAKFSRNKPYDISTVLQRKRETTKNCRKERKIAAVLPRCDCYMVFWWLPLAAWTETETTLMPHTHTFIYVCVCRYI